MAKGLKHGAGGGAPLNFKVVGGTSAPENPKENTIWVNTSAEITSWVFSTAQPSGAEGKVWIQTGIVSAVAFNALKKNGLQVYPQAAKQYVSGAWTAKTSRVYLSGAWESPEYLIVPNTSATWTKISGCVGSASASKSTSATTISMTTKSNTAGSAGNTGIYSEFDATGCSVFYIKGSYSMNNQSGSAQGYSIKILNSSGSTVSTIHSKTVEHKVQTGTVSFEKTVDITSLTGKCKLQVSCTSYTTATLTFSTTINSCKVY